MHAGIAKKLSLIYVVLVSAISLFALVYTSVVELPSMKRTAGGVPYLSSPVLNPDTGEAVDLGVLVRHFQGD